MTGRWNVRALFFDQSLYLQIMANLTLGVWSTSAGLKRIKLSNIDLENKVQVFRIQALQVLTNVRGNIGNDFQNAITTNSNTYNYCSRIIVLRSNFRR